MDEYVFADLVGAYEIASRLGFKRVQTLHGWLRTEGAGFRRRCAGSPPGSLELSAELVADINAGRVRQ